MSPKCGLPLKTLEEKILALMRKMRRDGRVRICSSNVEQCSYLSELLAPGRFTSRHFQSQCSQHSTYQLASYDRLTNDFRSRPVRGPFHGLGFRNRCKFNYLFGCAKVCKLATSLVINQDVCPFDVTMPICNPCDQCCSIY